MPNQKLTVGRVEALLTLMRCAGYDIAQFIDSESREKFVLEFPFGDNGVKIRIEVTKELCMNQLLANYDAARKAIFDHCGVPDDERGYPIEVMDARWSIDRNCSHPS